MFDPTIGAVVLAAGQSRRMGAGVVKAVLPFGGSDDDSWLAEGLT